MLGAFFKDLDATGPVLVEADANESWPKSVEINMTKRSVQHGYSYCADEHL